MMGIGDAEDTAGLGGRKSLQPHPVRQVTVEAAQPPLLQPLTRQQQMHVQRPAQTPHCDEQLGELRAMPQQLRKLVDDDHQRRQRRQIRAARPARGLVLRHAREIARSSQQLLPAGHLAANGVLHAVHEDQLVGQVRDHRRHVRQPLQPEEGRTALEVDEHQIELIGTVRGRQREDRGFQKLRLSRTRGPDAQAMRADPALRRFLQVQVQHRPVGADPHGNAQTLPPQPLPEHQIGRRRRQVQLRQHRVAMRPVIATDPGGGVPGQTPGQSLRCTGAESIGCGDVLLAGRGRRPHPPIDDRQRQPRGHGHVQRRTRRRD